MFHRRNGAASEHRLDRQGILTHTSEERGTPVTLWVTRGGGSAGVREPRRLLPGPQSAQEMRYDSVEAVS